MSAVVGGVVDRGLLAGELELFLERDDGRLDAELLGDLDRELLLDGLVDRREDPAREKRLHEVLREDAELLGQLLDRDALGEEDGPLGLLLDLDDLAGLRGHRLLAGAALRGLGERFGRERLVRPLGRRRRDVLVRVLLVGAEVLPHVFFERGDLLRARLLRLGLLRVALFDRKAGLRRVLLPPVRGVGQRRRGGPAERRTSEAGARAEAGAARAAGARGETGARCEAGARREARGTGRHAGPGTGGHDGRRRADGAQGAGARRRDDGAAEAAGAPQGSGRDRRRASLRGRRRRRGTHVRDTGGIRAGARAVGGHLVAALGRRRRRESWSCGAGERLRA